MPIQLVLLLTVLLVVLLSLLHVCIDARWREPMVFIGGHPAKY